MERLFTQVVDPQDCSFIKRRLQHRCFPVKFAKLLRTAFFTEHLQWLLQFGISFFHVAGIDGRGILISDFHFSVPFCEFDSLRQPWRYNTKPILNHT